MPRAGPSAGSPRSPQPAISPGQRQAAGCRLPARASELRPAVAPRYGRGGRAGACACGAVPAAVPVCGRGCPHLPARLRCSGALREPGGRRGPGSGRCGAAASLRSPRGSAGARPPLLQRHAAGSFGKREFGKGCMLFFFFSFYFPWLFLFFFFSGMDEMFLLSLSSRLNSWFSSRFFRPWERRYLGSAMTLLPSLGWGVGVGSRGFETSAQFSSSHSPVSFIQLGSSNNWIPPAGPVLQQMYSFQLFSAHFNQAWL